MSTFSLIIYREYYRNYYKRIKVQVRINKLNLKKFFKIVKSEVKTKDIEEIIEDTIVMLDDDKNPN